MNAKWPKSLQSECWHCGLKGLSERQAAVHYTRCLWRGWEDVNYWRYQPRKGA